MMCHPGTVFYYLLGKMIKPVQKQENVNRNNYVMPFICKHGNYNSYNHNITCANIINVSVLYIA